jgi:hypothetical protein
MFVPACGKKGPPSLPQKPFTATVVDLKGERVGDDIVLEGRISGLGEPAEVNSGADICRTISSEKPPLYRLSDRVPRPI